MNHSEKLQLMREHLSGLGLRESAFAPPFYRLLWRLGLEVPPPLFSGFLSLALLHGVFFGVGWGLLMWFGLWSWQWPPVPWYLALLGSALAGLGFGVIMAALLRHQARKLGLPSWSTYSGKPQQ